jgi:hypothetical protein
MEEYVSARAPCLSFKFLSLQNIGTRRNWFLRGELRAMTAWWEAN